MNVPFCLFFCILGILASPVEQKRKTTEPEILDKLLSQKRYEEFSEIMDLGNPELAHPKEEEKSLYELMLNKVLSEGDIVLSSKEQEQARQGIDFERHERYKWPNNQVPFAISDDFDNEQKSYILKSIESWNNQVNCLKFVPRTNHEDYVFFFIGQGCWSFLGRRGGEQALSLQTNGCLREGVIHHEMEHAVGFHHEHTRSDRDDYVNIVWENVPRGWEPNFEKNDPHWFGLQGSYDYYSVMHYPLIFNNKPLIEVKQDGVDESKVGTYSGFTEKDLAKISTLYC